MDAPDAPPLGRAEAEQIARTLRSMADPTRIQILSSLVGASDGRRAVTELAGELGLRQPTVSHHLRLMTEEGLLERAQEGRQVWYSISPSRVNDVADSLRADPVAAVVAPAVLDRIAADLTVRFSGVFSSETIVEYVRESYALLADRAGITRYLPSLTARFADERLDALARVDGPGTDSTPEILFVCVQNAGRSQLASAILRSLAGDRVRVRTAGSEPAGSINPTIIAALDEIGKEFGTER